MINELWLVFIISFVSLLILKRKKYYKNKKFDDVAFNKDTEIIYLKNMYDLNFDKFSLNAIIIILAITNSLCITIAYWLYSIMSFGSYVLNLLVLFVIIVLLIIILYYIVGLIFKKR